MFHIRNRIGLIILCMLFVFGPGIQASAQSPKPVVIIDAAHGGEDSGVIGLDRVAEKDLTLALALALKKELEQISHLEVVMTRKDDRTVTLDERRKIIAAKPPALVLSLHVNAGFTRNASGYELYYPGFPDTSLQTRGKKPAAAEDLDHLNNTVKLSRLIQRNLDALFPRKGRGLREATIPLYDGQNVAGLVVELGFLTNAEDKRKLSTAKTQAQVAKALADSIRSFF